MEIQSCADHELYTFSVMMLPWLAHGHVSPYLELAKRLSRQHHILVHICSTPINLDPIREHLDRNQKKYNYIRLVELHLPPLPGLPPQLHTTKYLPPHLMPTLKKAFDLAEPSFCRLLDDLQPDLLIYDFIQPWAPLSAQSRGIPAIHFMTSGAAATSFFCHYLVKEGSFPFPFQAISLGGLHQDMQYTSMLNKVVDDEVLADRERLLHSLECSTGFIAIKSFREIEFKYIDYFSSLIGKEVMPVGPLVPDDAENVVGSEELERAIMRWLSKRERSSVVFVSFGSEYFMSEEEMIELALGLELSEASFIWVVRFPTKEQEGEEERERERRSERELPRGFMERVVRERGMVVEGWAPQRSILAQQSLGAFLTHCGWSSVMEGMRFGVPMVALPLHLDQPLNAKLVVELGVGVLVPSSSNDQLGGVGKFKGHDVAKGIRDVLFTKKGEGVKAKAKEMAQTMSRRDDEQEIQVMVEKMTALCSDNANKRRRPQFATD
ncbi:UDP-glucosyltransferase 29-like [Typha latifolia]|uniref:UDP-glucosyltransferase 29-like n=1 Tax=Typha latifolia TaxID=4733 RepID=UPI003C2D786B